VQIDSVMKSFVKYTKHVGRCVVIISAKTFEYFPLQMLLRMWGWIKSWKWVWLVNWLSRKYCFLLISAASAHVQHVSDGCPIVISLSVAPTRSFTVLVAMVVLAWFFTPPQNTCLLYEISSFYEKN